MRHYTVVYLVFVWGSGAMCTSEHREAHPEDYDGLVAQYGPPAFYVTRVRDDSW